MSSETTPHTFQQEHYSEKSMMQGYAFPILMIVVGATGILAMLTNML